MVAIVTDPVFSSEQRAQQYREANPPIGIQATYKAPTFNPIGGVVNRDRTTWLGGQVENRLRLNALSSMDGDPGIVDYLINDVFTNIFAYENTEDLTRMVVMNNFGSGQYLSNKDGTIIDQDNLTSDKVPDYLNPVILQTLQERGVDFTGLKDLTVEDAIHRIKREILAISLSDELEASANTLFEKAAGPVIEFGAGFLDLTTIATLGTAGLAKGVGVKAIRSTVQAEAKSTILNKAIANTTRRFGRNQTISGSLIDNSFTRNHAATMLGFDAAFTSVGFDLALQKKEHDILERYYSDYDAPWFNFNRSLVSGGFGFALGGGIGKLFGVSKAPRERAKIVNDVMRKIGKDLSPEQHAALKQMTEDFTYDQRTLPSLRNLYDTVGEEKGLDVLQVMLEDMINADIAKFDNGKLVGDNQLRSQYLKERINSAVNNARKSFDVTQEQLDNFNVRWEANESTIERLSSYLTEDPYKTPDGPRLKKLSDEVKEQRKVARLQLKEALRKRETLNKEQADISVQLRVSNDIKQREGAISGRTAGGSQAPKDLSKIGGPATQVIVDVPTTQQTATNVAYQIAAFLRRNPTFEELDNFLSHIDVNPTQRAVKLQKQVNRIIELENSRFIAKSLSNESPQTTGFTTERGSTYTVDSEGRTTRNKAKRAEHGNDSGLKPTSDKTVFVSSEAAQEIGMMQGLNRESEASVSITNKGIKLSWKSGVSEDGKPYGKINTKLIPYTDKPEIGKHPVEFWDNGNYHPGSKITKLDSPVTPESIDAVVNNAIADVKEKHIDRLFAKKQPNEWETSFEFAVRRRAEAAEVWRKVEEDQTLTALERNALIQEAITAVDEANKAIDSVINSVIGSMDKEFRKGDNDRARYASWLEGHQLVPVSKRSSEAARALLEAHFIDYGSAPPIYSDNFLTRFLYSDIVNKISGAGTPRHVMVEVAKGSPELAMAINMIGDLTNVSVAYGGRNKYVPSLEIMQRRYLRKVDQLIFQPQKRLRARIKDNAEYIELMKQAYRYAANLDSAPSDPDALALAKGLKKFYGDIGIKANKEGVLRTTNPYDYLNISLKASLGDDSAESAKVRAVIVDELLKHWERVYKPESGSPIRVSILSFIDIIAPSPNLAASGEKSWVFRNVRLSAKASADSAARKIDFEKGYDNFELLSVLDYETLFDLEYRQDDGSWKSVGEIYNDNFRAGLKDEAEKAVSNRVRLSGKAEVSDGALLRQSRQSQYHSLELRRENASQRRLIPDSVLLSKAVLDTGAVHFDPVMDAHHYWFSFASDLALQENMTRLTGKTGITWESFVSFAIEKHKKENINADGKPKYTDKFYGDFEAFLLAAKDSVSGRSYVRNEADSFTTGVLQFANHVLSSGVNAAVGLISPATELAMPALTHMMVSKNRKAKMTEMLRAVKSLNKDQRWALGNSIHQATGASRVLTETHEVNNEIYMSYWQRLAAPWIRFKDAVAGEGTAKTFQASTNTVGGRFANSAVAFAEALSDTTRNISGELLWTYMGHNIFGQYHTNMVGRQLDKIIAAQAIIGNIKGPIPERMLRGIARDKGLDYLDLVAYMDSGLIIQGPNRGLDLLAALKARGADRFGDTEKVYQVIETFDSPLYRQEIREMYDRVLDHATKQVDRDITNPRVWDRPAHANNALVSIIHRYLSFARGFRNGRMADLANAGVLPFSQAYIGYMMAELFNRNMMSVVFHGDSIDDLIERWEEEPEKMTVYSLAGVPLFGGGQSVLTSVVANVFDADNQLNSSFVPSGSMFRRKISAVNSVLRGIRSEDDEVRDEDLIELARSIPGINHATSMILLNQVMTSDDDD